MIEEEQDCEFDPMVEGFGKEMYESGSLCCGWCIVIVVDACVDVLTKWAVKMYFTVNIWFQVLKMHLEQSCWKWVFGKDFGLVKIVISEEMTWDEMDWFLNFYESFKRKSFLFRVKSLSWNVWKVEMFGVNMAFMCLGVLNMTYG